LQEACRQAIGIGNGDSVARYSRIVLPREKEIFLEFLPVARAMLLFNIFSVEKAYE
jgi:hypothetical protein